MKLYNRELEEIENPERYNRIQNILKRQIEFLVNEYGIDEKLLRDRADKLAVIERNPKDATFFIEYNGEKKEFSIDGSAAAFTTLKNQIYHGNKCSFEVGIYMSDSNSDHSIAHELFHFLSNIQEMEFNENGIGYAKCGTLIPGYDREDNLIDKSLDAEGLNEGITELLTTKMYGNKPNAYEIQSNIADILISKQHNSLLEGYFSEDINDFQKFLDEFDSRQNTVSSKQLIDMTKNGQMVVETKLLQGCLEYALSFCNNMEELKAERKRLIPIFEDISNNFNIDFDKEGFDVKQFFNETLLKKREEIMALSERDNDALLVSAVEVTEETTKTSTINGQAEGIQDVSQGKNVNVSEKGEQK